MCSGAEMGSTAEAHGAGAAQQMRLRREANKRMERQRRQPAVTRGVHGDLAQGWGRGLAKRVTTSR